MAPKGRLFLDEDEASGIEGALQASGTADESRSAEEQYREAPYVPSTSSGAAPPPPPPRASVDFQPAAPDDPRDFVLR